MKKGFTPLENFKNMFQVSSFPEAEQVRYGAGKFHDKGFTLIEILVTLGIFVFVGVTVLSIYFLSQRFYQRGETRAEVLQNGRIILERLAREIRQADEMVTQLPQVPDSPDNPPPNEIEFEDGHTPSPYAYLGSDYYYIRYYIFDGSGEVHRQYRVYCFDACEVCADYFRWNDTRMEGEEVIETSPCNLEDKIIGEYVDDMAFWGAGVIDLSLTLQKDSEQIDLQTKVFGRNL